MARLVALKLTGETDYWLVDLDARTVEPMQPTVKDPFGYTADASASGATFTSGLDVAVVAETREDAFSGKFDT